MGGRKSFTVLAVVLGLTLARSDAAAPDKRSDFRVIVNPANPVRAISRAFLRDAFLKKATRWSPGSTIRPVDLSRHSPARQRFVAEVLGKTPGQLRSYWSQLIFSGKAVPPPELDSEAAVVAYVLRHTGGVGYLPADADPGGAATVTLK